MNPAGSNAHMMMPGGIFGAGMAVPPTQPPGGVPFGLPPGLPPFLPGMPMGMGIPPPTGYDCHLSFNLESFKSDEHILL